jgi:hypothetical protein
MLSYSFAEEVDTTAMEAIRRWSPPLSNVCTVAEDRFWMMSFRVDGGSRPGTDRILTFC